MTDAQPTPAAPLDFSNWKQMEQDHKSRADAVLSANKTVLFDALAAAGIEIVTVVFDGQGDSGQIVSIEARTGDAVIALPDDRIEIATPVWGSAGIQRQTLPVHDAIEELAYAFLGQTHGGWENDGGAYGDFTFAVKERTITLDYNERIEDTDYSQHVF